jgi:putative membrane protein
MCAQQEDSKLEPCDPRIYLAAERTFLAWIRTGLALMGFGFIAARFGLFLRVAFGSSLPERTGISLPVGIALIILGVIVNVSAALRHHRYLQALDRGEFRSAFGSTFASLIAGILAVIGLALALYMSRI